MPRTVTIGHVDQPPAVARPDDVGINRRPARDAHRFAAVARTCREYLSMHDKCNLPPVARKGHLRKASAKALMFDCRSGHRATELDRHLLSVAGLRIDFPNCKIALEDDCSPVARNRRPGDATFLKGR